MQLIDQFIQERVYLKGVLPKTIIWYRNSFKAFDEALASKHTIMQRIAELRKEEQKILNTFSTEQIARLLAWKPRRTSERRLHALVSLLLDTGLRISEALALSRDGSRFRQSTDLRSGRERRQASNGAIVV